MRIMLLASVAVLTLLSQAEAQKARHYPWCQTYTNDGPGGESCMFETRQQCLNTIRGMGGFCVRNPWNWTGDEERPRRRKSQPRG
jgi:Protein of unknown function (DUF3551)